MENKSSSKGLGADIILTIVFVILKLCGVINWSWWWVLSPLWIGLALFIVLVAIIIIVKRIKNGKLWWQC